MLDPRSYLFVPAVKLDMIRKARSSDADCVIIDLEDSVAISKKQIARENVYEALKSTNSQKPMIVRINDMQSSLWKEDIICALKAEASGVMLPKAEKAEDILTLCETIEVINSEHDHSNFQIVPLIETAKGIQKAGEIAEASEKIHRLAFGSIDYSLDIDCQLTPEGLELLFARSQIVNASRAAGIAAPIDAVFPDLNNEEGLIREATFARQLGFKSKLMVHPKQIPGVHQVFSLSESELRECEEIVHLFEEAENQGLASISYKGRLLDYPVYSKAKKVIENNNEIIKEN